MDKTHNYTLSAIYHRKSVRTYLPEKAISASEIDLLIRAGMAAPSGKDTRPWEIIVVNERAILDTLAQELPYAKMLKNAPVAVIVCGDETISSYWFLDCSAVTQNILLAAETLGLGAVWTAAYPYEDRMTAVAKQIGLPDNIKALSVIPIGYPGENKKHKDKYDKNKIHYNKW